jgi:hypothetical protein
MKICTWVFYWQTSKPGSLGWYVCQATNLLWLVDIDELNGHALSKKKKEKRFEWESLKTYKNWN